MTVVSALLDFLTVRDVELASSAVGCVVALAVDALGGSFIVPGLSCALSHVVIVKALHAASFLAAVGG